MENVVEVRGLQKVYGSKTNNYVALNGVDLDIKEGEFVGIMGPSGAGKSTLLNIVSTIDKPSNGSVHIGGKNIVNMNENDISDFRRKKLGFIFQDFNLLDNLTVKENMVLPLALSKTSVKEIEVKVKDVARKLNISDILNKYPYEISGGQKQRTAAGRAIITNPNIILADEPTGALDSKSSKELLESLSNLNERDNATIMMVTHDAFSASYCERILFIKDGKIFTQIRKGTHTRKQFFDEILNVLSELGGEVNDLV